jgi:F-type H+-transporting ATPase subunit b
LWTAYTLLVHKKLQQVLARRHALTEGAIERAQQEIAIAEKRTAEYEQRVRDARSQIYKAQQANRQRVLDERNAALAESRKNAGEMVKKARAALEKDTAGAKAALEQQANVLADQVIARILKPAAAAGGW